ncbi:MAG: ATP synthase F0 subunit C [Deltaproteobacteria bacterium]|jgi:F-type H+-transporting ATPase subunit c|nr:ATP synthase F0 subunit C [Deltaproteobacteria bacterium]
MRKLFTAALGVLCVLASAGMALAADAAPAALDADGLGLAAFAMAIGMGLAAAGCGIGQGLGLKGACEGVARNPEASNKLTNTLLLGLAFIESLAIYTFVICLVLLFVRPLG